MNIKNTYITYSISLVIGPANKLTESPSGKEFHFIFSSLETGLYIGNVKIKKKLNKTESKGLLICLKPRNPTPFVKRCECVSALKGQSDKMSSSGIVIQLWEFFSRAVREGLMEVDKKKKTGDKSSISREDVLHK